MFEGINFRLHDILEIASRIKQRGDAPDKEIYNYLYLRCRTKAQREKIKETVLRLS